jgi:hypothetical protein
MNIEISSDNLILSRPEIDLNLQHLQEPTRNGGILSDTSSKGETAEDTTLSVQTTASALPGVDPKSRLRRRNPSPRHESGKLDTAAAHPVTNSAEAATENLAGQSRIADDSGIADDEAALAKQIGQLWSSVQFRTYRIYLTRRQLTAYRADLARELYRYKALLVSSGRSGKWSAFLREINIPRATADRYVQRWECSLVGENRLSEAISPPTAEEVIRMVDRIKPKLLRVLTTADAVEQFMAALGAALQVPRSS